MTRLVVAPDSAGLRLDQFLATVTGLPRRRIRALISEGSVRLNDRPKRIQSQPLVAGDVVDVLRPPEELGRPPIPDYPRVRLLHEDRWLVVADKPAGVLSQPASDRGGHELALDQILLLSIARREGRRPFLRLVHRLDRLTSGVLVFARNPEALPALSRSWARGEVERLYLALVEGRPTFDRTLLSGAIGRDPKHAWRFRVTAEGRAASTRVRVIRDLGPDLALVLCALTTGRTHQVRVHLAEAGHPVLGDRLYGSRRGGEAPRPLLHAVSLSLPHPRTGEELRVVSPIPDDFHPLLGDDIPDPADLVGLE